MNNEKSLGELWRISVTKIPVKIYQLTLVWKNRKLYNIHKQEPVIENETHIILLDFEIQMDRLIQAKRPDLEIVTTEWKQKKAKKQTST